MILMKRLRLRRKKEEDAVVTNEAILVDADLHHQEALVALEAADVQAQKLADMDVRNHYSESMTYAFRGKTA